MGEPREWNWTLWQTVKRAAAQKLGIGDPDILKKYKDAWVIAHKDAIKSSAASADIPVVLLAGVCWIEVGGDPDFVDRYAYNIRSFDHMADPFLEPVTITKQPQLTSMGDVSIQLRRAAETMGWDWDTMTSEQTDEILTCLANEPCNVSVVARHLADLKKIDFSDVCPVPSELIRIVGHAHNLHRPHTAVG